MKRIFVLCCLAALCLPQAAATGGHAQDKAKQATAKASKARTVEPLPLDHGGRIESKYDGFKHETTLTLNRMSVTCEDVRGSQGRLKGVCVAVSASLHCPGKQLDYVRQATLRLTFKTQNWDSRHPLDERALTVVADGETIKVGKMQLLSQGIGEGWGDPDSEEVLEISVPYATFEKMARATFVEMSVGKTSFGLREKNVAALRDLGNRVNITRRQNAGAGN